MKKILMLTLSLLIIFLTSSSTINNTLAKKSPVECTNGLQTLEKKLHSLEVENSQLKTLIDNNTKEKKNFFELSNLSSQFVQAHTKGDLKEIEPLLSKEIKLISKKNEIYAITKYKNLNNIEWSLYDKNSKDIYQYMVIQSYNYISNDDIYIMNIKEVYADSNGNIVTPPTYLNLHIKQINNIWQIVYLEFDV